MEINSHPIIDLTSTALFIEQARVVKQSMETQFNGGLTAVHVMIKTKGSLIDTEA